MYHKPRFSNFFLFIQTKLLSGIESIFIVSGNNRVDNDESQKGLDSQDKLSLYLIIALLYSMIGAIAFKIYFYPTMEHWRMYPVYIAVGVIFASIDIIAWAKLRNISVSYNIYILLGVTFLLVSAWYISSINPF